MNHDFLKKINGGNSRLAAEKPGLAADFPGQQFLGQSKNA